MSSLRSFFDRDRAFAILLGLHGLALMVVFPLGPQEARLWQPGVRGVAALAAAFPLAATLAGICARRAARLPGSPRSLAVLGLLSTLPCVFSRDYPSLVAARVFAGFAAGISGVAIHRALPLSAGPAVARLAPRIVAFGMPLCLLAATALDWRFGFLPLTLGFAAVALCHAPGKTLPALAPTSLSRGEPAPWGLVAAGALAFVTAAYLTVLSGYLVFNAGHTEFHIPVVLLGAALLGLVVPRLVGRLHGRMGPAAFYAASLAASLLVLFALLALQNPFPAPAAITTIAAFLVVNSTRHLALARLLSPVVPPDRLVAHQIHTHLAHLAGTALGAVAAGYLVTLTPQRHLAGMPRLLAASLAATAFALLAGLAAQRKASPTA